MGNRKAMRTVLALLLLAAMTASLCPVALAFEGGQYYETSAGQTDVYTVQVAAMSTRSGAEAIRDLMLDRGYDCFVMKTDSGFGIMCGKFRASEDAEAYRSDIAENTRYTGASVVTVSLPERAVQDFEGEFDGNSVEAAEAAAAERETEEAAPGNEAADAQAEDEREVTPPVTPQSPLNDMRLYDTYPSGQRYAHNSANPQVWTVQLAAYDRTQPAQDTIDRMLYEGFDGFIYDMNGTVFVMSGKFVNRYDAMCYAESLHRYSNYNYTAYVTTANLPQEAVDEFAKLFYSHIVISDNRSAMQTHWEIPTGEFFRDDGPNNEATYTIQCSTGTSFVGAESFRDTLRALGFKAYVYKADMFYMTMVGTFATFNDAQAYLPTLLAGTGLTDAYVTGVMLPSHDVPSLNP